MVDNPYLREFEAEENCEFMPEYYEKRRELTKKYAWAIPNDEALQAIAEVGPIVEIGSGTGYWAKLLREYGVDILAFDQHAGDHAANYYRFTHTWSEVQFGNSYSAKRYPERTLMLCWPCYNEPFANQALKSYKGDTFVYIGEGMYGCNGDKAFHERLERDWECIKTVHIPQWDSVRDRLEIYKRKVK